MSIKEPTKSAPRTDLHSVPVSEEVRRRAVEAIPRLRAHSDEILARRGGRLIDVEAAAQKAHLAHERGE